MKLTPIALLLLCQMPRTANEEPPSVAHVHEFRTGQAYSQMELCREHIDRLTYLQRYSPGDTRFERWIAETEWMLRFWVLVDEASSPGRFCEDYRRAKMYALWYHIGPKRYEERWHPTLLPTNMLPQPRRASD